MPLASDEWFEWHSLLSAVTEARGSFTMVELGAGFGRWAVAGGIAARKIGLPAHFVCVEAEPTHFAMISEHMRDNGVDPGEHRLICAAVTAVDGPVYFTVGRARDWWGQATLPSADYGYGALEGVNVQTVPGISLATALHNIPRVDLIDMDVQGAEADVIEAALPLLRDRVHRLHIGTHSAEVEERIWKMLPDAGFRPVWDFPCGTETLTPIGSIVFGDGVQAWCRD
jgi:FkbM family methyltransferase